MAAAAPPTFPRLLTDWVRPHGERVFLPRRRARIDDPITFLRLCTDVDALAKGLLALGLRRGDRIGLLAENRYEWLLTDQAIASIGAIVVPRGSDTSPAEMRFILRHSGSKATFVEDDKTARAVLEGQRELPTLTWIITLQERTDVAGVLTLAEVIARGQHIGEPELASVRQAVVPDDLLTIVYTSGTTADPKGVMLTHANVLSNVRTVCSVLHITREDSFLSVLPAWHMYERIMDYLALAAGGQLVYTDRRHIKDDLQACKPTVFAAVPRIWETIHDGIVSQAQKLEGGKGKLLRSVLALCRRVGGRRASLVDRAMHAVARATVLRKFAAVTGGRLRLAVSGGGSLPRHVDELLLGIGLPLLNGYGLTETSPVAAVREPERNGPGTIGPPIPETEIHARSFDGKVLGAGQTGVLWIRGPQVMRGYYENPAKTREAIDAEGWFNSGDLGHVDADGRVWITGRAKDTIVLAGGENVEPEPVEAAIKTSPLIEQAVCVGQDQKNIGALLVPITDVLARQVPREQWDVRDGVVHGKAVRDLLRAELDRLVRRETGFRPCDKVTAFAVLAEPLTAENGLLTQTLKVRRHVVAERYRPIIASLFD
ncbi:MAG: AMP-binding protein [Planctomycetes bacterium]|nr:AMP-binding protein [Planctomycetota bacterium]